MYRLLPLMLIICCYSIGSAAAPLRDPTQPPNTPPTHSNGNNLKVDTVFVNKNNSTNSFITLRGHNYTIGDKIADATIVAINAATITLRDTTGEFIAPLTIATIKYPVTNKDGYGKEHHEINTEK